MSNILFNTARACLAIGALTSAFAGYGAMTQAEIFEQNSRGLALINQYAHDACTPVSLESKKNDYSAEAKASAGLNQALKKTLITPLQPIKRYMTFLLPFQTNMALGFGNPVPALFTR